jgi:hypothetical protein
MGFVQCGGVVDNFMCSYGVGRAGPWPPLGSDLLGEALWRSLARFIDRAWLPFLHRRRPHAGMPQLVQRPASDPFTALLSAVLLAPTVFFPSIVRQRVLLRARHHHIHSHPHFSILLVPRTRRRQAPSFTCPRTATLGA